jgi:hypothetical protein
MTIEELIKVRDAGYLGILPSGMLVDTRKHPTAIPVPKNELLQCPQPKQS